MPVASHHHHDKEKVPTDTVKYVLGLEDAELLLYEDHYFNKMSISRDANFIH